MHLSVAPPTTESCGREARRSFQWWDQWMSSECKVTFMDPAQSGRETERRRCRIRDIKAGARLALDVSNVMCFQNNCFQKCFISLLSHLRQSCFSGTNLSLVAFGFQTPLPSLTVNALAAGGKGVEFSLVFIHQVSHWQWLPGRG